MEVATPVRDAEDVTPQAGVYQGQGGAPQAPNRHPSLPMLRVPPVTGPPVTPRIMSGRARNDELQDILKKRLRKVEGEKAVIERFERAAVPENEASENGLHSARGKVSIESARAKIAEVHGEDSQSDKSLNSSPVKVSVESTRAKFERMHDEGLQSDGSDGEESQDDEVARRQEFPRGNNCQQPSLDKTIPSSSQGSSKSSSISPRKWEGNRNIVSESPRRRYEEAASSTPRSIRHAVGESPRWRYEEATGNTPRRAGFGEDTTVGATPRRNLMGDVGWLKVIPEFSNAVKEASADNKSEAEQISPLSPTIQSFEKSSSSSTSPPYATTGKWKNPPKHTNYYHGTPGFEVPACTSESDRAWQKIAKDSPRDGKKIFIRGEQWIRPPIDGCSRGQEVENEGLLLTSEDDEKGETSHDVQFSIWDQVYQAQGSLSVLDNLSETRDKIMGLLIGSYTVSGSQGPLSDGNERSLEAEEESSSANGNQRPAASSSERSPDVNEEKIGFCKHDAHESCKDSSRNESEMASDAGGSEWLPGSKRCQEDTHRSCEDSSRGRVEMGVTDDLSCEKVSKDGDIDIESSRDQCRDPPKEACNISPFPHKTCDDFDGYLMAKNEEEGEGSVDGVFPVLQNVPVDHLLGTPRESHHENPNHRPVSLQTWNYNFQGNQFRINVEIVSVNDRAELHVGTDLYGETWLQWAVLPPKGTGMPAWQLPPQTTWPKSENHITSLAEDVLSRFQECSIYDSHEVGQSLEMDLGPSEGPWVVRGLQFRIFRPIPHWWFGTYFPPEDLQPIEIVFKDPEPDGRNTVVLEESSSSSVSKLRHDYECVLPSF